MLQITIETLQFLRESLHLLRFDDNLRHKLLTPFAASAFLDIESSEFVEFNARSGFLINVTDEQGSYMRKEVCPGKNIAPPKIRRNGSRGSLITQVCGRASLLYPQ